MKKYFFTLFTAVILNQINYAQTTKLDYEILKQNPLFYNSKQLKLINNLCKLELNKLRRSLLNEGNPLYIDRGAYEGTMGKFNKKAVNQRGKRFVKRIKKKGLNSKIKVHIEGDSWFNFPIALKSDISKLLGRTMCTNLLVSNSAYGGDLLTNMMYEHTYLDSLIKFKPETFIISGGGNDLIGNGNINYCLNYPEKNNFLYFINKKYILSRGKNRDYNQNRTLQNPDSAQDTLYLLNLKTNEEKQYLKDVLYGSTFLTKDFFESIQRLEVFYRIMFSEIKLTNTLHDMQIITQGYDNVIPSRDIIRGPNPLRWGVNLFTGTGKWLYFPFRTNGIDNSENQKKIMKAMIFYFNEMLLDLTYELDENNKFQNPNNFHIDNRGIVDWVTKDCFGKETRFWFDEIHPRRRPYKFISRNYKYLIYNYFLDKNSLTEKSYRTFELISNDTLSKKNIKKLRERVIKKASNRVKY